MKKTNLFATLISLAVIMCSTAEGQVDYAKYYSPYLETTYNVEMSSKGRPYTLYVDMASVDKHVVDKTGVMLEEKQHAVFIEAFYKAIEKYKEWSKVAVQNNVSKHRKSMSMEAEGDAYFYTNDEWHFHFKCYITFEFVVDKGKSLLLIHTGPLQSSATTYVKHAGAIIVFSSADEAYAFAEMLSVDKAIKFVEATPVLFKD